MESSERYRAIVAALEVMDGGVCVTDASGRLLHENGVLRRQLAEGSRALEDAIADVRGAALARAANETDLASRNGNGLVAQSVTIQLRTDEAQYEIEGTAVEPEGSVPGGERLVVVVVRERRARRMTPDALRAAYGLTARELRVALLLDAGVRSRELAEALGISVHTARRHVESVLRKLGVHSRAEVRQRLNG